MHPVEGKCARNQIPDPKDGSHAVVETWLELEVAFTGPHGGDTSEHVTLTCRDIAAAKTKKTPRIISALRILKAEQEPVKGQPITACRQTRTL